MSQEVARIREIPYNYTSFSDREIILRFLGEEMWDEINALRTVRRTGRSARMLFEVLGDLWIVTRNPFLQDDLIKDKKRGDALVTALHHRLDQILARADGNKAVFRLVDAARKAIEDFSAWIPLQRSRRQQVRKRLAKITRKDNIHFDGIARTSHATDASDWRVEMPFVVIVPDTEQELAALVRACIELDLSIVPRGGGTGYTGGAIPLDECAAVINTEKLEALSEIKMRKVDGADTLVPTVRAEAGVVTKRVSELAGAHGYIFAVDPTSQDASTIGGNVAMNAGGKKAVQWGTTLDNLVSWRMVTPQGEWMEVERIGHNLGKIHEQERVRFQVTQLGEDGESVIGEPTLIEVAGASLRKVGLGKDVTSKFLGGIPGIQKEGCDGLISSAVFVLHTRPKFMRTVCLEFFGADLSHAVSAIVEIKAYIGTKKSIVLSGLEHLDDRYIKAINYSSKAARNDLPKMVLLADLAGDDEQRVAEVAAAVVSLASQRDGEGFVAVSAEARRRFWLDRSRTAAIAAHTNAFKINEDVVIPLDRLAHYSTQIERINIEQSILNKLKSIDAIIAFLARPVRELFHKFHALEQASEESDQILAAKQANALAHLQTVRQRWSSILAGLDVLVEDLTDLLTPQELEAAQQGDRLIDLLLRRVFVVSYRGEVDRWLKEIFHGQETAALCREFDKIHENIRSSRLFIATHMHAGDGNVHTNIPVHSNDYEMMQEADHLVDRVMALAVDLGGVISGEHGIGITKYKYLDQAQTEAFVAYKTRVDPNNIFNRGKLMPNSDLRNAYTPSLRLVQQEALILEASELGALNDDIRHCLRCGKCKPVCATHIPRANLLYSPRNKILATGMLIEAFLYEEQTRRGVSSRHFEQMNDVADHCTVCHKCLNPCPVDIDFGDVSIRMRKILTDHGRKHVNLGTKVSMAYLNATDPAMVKLLHKSVIQWGYKAQRLAQGIVRQVAPRKPLEIPADTTGKPRISTQIVQLVRDPLPLPKVRKTMRALLEIENKQFIPIVRNAKIPSEDAEAVFYFPGCGSERLFSEISLATLAMLYQVGTQTVLPPGYLCCGYPQSSAGQNKKGAQITTENRVLFHRVANTLNYLDIKKVIVSCGTCMDQLLTYEFEKIFPGCQLLDIHEYLMEKGVSLESSSGEKYLYHDPCHSPMKTHDPLQVAASLLSSDVLASDRCCGEAGTLAVSRPDIADQLRSRKREELQHGIEELTGGRVVENKPVKLLTSCPACQQGLSRYQQDTGLETEYIVVALVRQLIGENWSEQFIENMQNGGIERVLL